MEETTNYKLQKPSENDYAEIDVINGNMDIIDAELKKRAEVGENGEIPTTQLSDQVFIQAAEPVSKKCFWIKPLSEASKNEEAILELSDNTGGKYFAEIDGVSKSIDNIVEEESELQQGKYNFDIL